jgi:hypothetical protein
MSRSTQYIGLNKYALKYVNGYINYENFILTKDMFDNGHILGTIYNMPVPEGPNKEYSLIETIQTTPWSGGPMIFTCLRSVLVKESGQIIEDEEELFRWMIDPSLKDIGIEYDRETGRYYV